MINAFNTDSWTEVKLCAITSLDELSKHINEEIVLYHEKILPMLISGINSDKEEIIEICLIELSYFCQNADLEIEPYIDQLILKLSNILDSNYSTTVHSETLFALCALINVANDLLNNVLVPILLKCKQIIETKRVESEDELRANALNCVSEIAYVIKLEKFKPYSEYFSFFALESIKSDVYELQGAGFTYFSSYAKIMGEPFSDNFSLFLPICFEKLKDESGLVKKEDKKDEFEMDSDSEDDEDYKENGDLMINTAFIDSKCSNIQAVASFFEANPKNFIQYLDEVLIIFESLWNYVEEGVTMELVEAYKSMLKSLHIALSGSKEGELHKLTNEFWIKIYDKYDTVIKESDSKPTIIKCFESLFDIFEFFGKKIMTQNLLNRLVELCNLVLEFKTVAQAKNDDENAEEDFDHDEKILGGIVDIYITLSENLGNDFHPFLTETYSSLIKYTRKDRNEEDRSMIIGLLAEVVRFCKISIKFYVDSWMVMIKENIEKNAKKKHEELYRHCVYFIGILFESGPEEMRGYIEECLNLLQAVYENSANVAKDNVLSALVRISISMNINKQSNFFRIILGTILKNIPLNHDPIENKNIFSYIVFVTDSFELKDFEEYLIYMMNCIKFLIFNEIKCRTDKDFVLKVKNYLEKINTNNIIKQAIDNYVNQHMNDKERERFITTMKNTN